MNTETIDREIISFEVVGQPATQGSKVEQVIRGKGGVPIVKNGRTLTTIREDNPRLAQWRQEVAHAASQVYSGPLLTGAVTLTLAFGRPRPKSHYGTGRNANVLKPSAPKYPITKPDVSKLTRAVEDALTGVIWRDDSQVQCLHVTKEFTERFHVWVTVETELEHPESPATDGQRG